MDLHNVSFKQHLKTILVSNLVLAYLPHQNVCCCKLVNWSVCALILSFSWPVIWVTRALVFTGQMQILSSNHVKAVCSFIRCSRLAVCLCSAVVPVQLPVKCVCWRLLWLWEEAARSSRASRRDDSFPRYGSRAQVYCSVWADWSDQSWRSRTQSTVTQMFFLTNLLA